MFQKNDVYLAGDNLVANGDALSPQTIQGVIGNRKIALILSDMPYAVDYKTNKFESSDLTNPKAIINDHFQTDSEYKEFTSGWLELIKPHLTDKNSYYLFNSDKMLFAMREGLLDAGFKFSQLLVWVKNHAVLGRLNYLPQHELIAYGWYGTHKFYKSQHKSVLFYPKPNKSRLHPTMKPVSLLRDLILNSTKVGDYVYDPFLGSGSTLLACEQTKRKCIGIELDPKYCQVTIDRFEKMTGKKAVKL